MVLKRIFPFRRRKDRRKLKEESDCIVVNTHIDSSVIGEENTVSLEKPATPQKGPQSSPLKVVLPVQTMESGSKMYVTGTVDAHGHSESEAATTTDNNNDSNKAFECDISTMKGSQKQEWSFTLYDFDGHGKVTKDDLAQLLKSLYDSIGSSIHLPDRGAKTVKLRLTVSPDRTGDSPTITPQNSTSDIGAKQNNIATAAAQARKRPQVMDMTNNLSEKYASPAAMKTCEKAGLKARSNQHDEKKETERTEAGPGEVVASIDQRHLVQLVKRNMERHQQRTRRHASRRQHSESKPLVASRRTPVQHGENVDRRNYYLDLAGVENTTPTALTERMPSHIPGCPAHETPTRLLYHVPTRRLHDTQRSGSRPQHHADVPSSNRRTKRAHHQSPRQRQVDEEQCRAMQQVAEWIEKEHLSPQAPYHPEDVTHHEHHHVHEHHHHHHYHHYHPPA